MSELRPFLEELQTVGQVTLNVKVAPKSAGNQIAGRMADGTLKVKVAAPPEKGKANAELRAFLARQFGVPKANVTIRSGETSPRKRVRIVGASRVSRTS